MGLGQTFAGMVGMVTNVRPRAALYMAIFIARPTGVVL